MTKVLISGCGGFVGHHFLEHVLSKTDWDVIATDSFRHKGKTDRIREVLENGPHDDAGRSWWAKRVSVVTHDLTVPFSEQTVENMGAIDYIVAYASESHVDRSISDPVPFVQNNVNVCLSTLELARRVKPKALVWVSTDEVYGAVEEHDLTGHPEWAPILPSNPYSASKAAQEAIAISYWRTYGVPLVIVNCFDMATRVMTPDGPKRHDELKLGDRVWAMDDNGKLVAEKITQLFRRPGPDSMVRVNAKGANYLVTPDHRMMVRRRHGKAGTYGPVEECRAQDLLGLKGRVRIPRTAEWGGHSSPVIHPYDHFTPRPRRDAKTVPSSMDSGQVASLFGWYISEGCTTRTQVRIAGSKPGQQLAIRDALAGIEGRVGSNDECVWLSNGDLVDWMTTTGTRSQDKRVPQFIKGMSAEYLKVFFEAACAGDGTPYGNGGVYYTTSEKLAWDMAEVAIKLGFSARVSDRETWNPAKTAKKRSWIMRYSLCAGEVEARNVTEEPYTGDVWCLSVESGRVFTEREGIVSLAGQCMNMIGERQDLEKFVPLVVRKVLAGDTVTIHGTEDHIGTRHYLHARNLADGILFLLRRPQRPSMFPAHVSPDDPWTSDRPDRYNIAAPERIDNLTLAKMIADYAGKELRYELEDFHATRPGHDPHYGLDPAKLQNLGWDLPVPFDKSLKKTVEWTLAHPEWLLPDV